jgi:hypothetical protein
LNPLNRQAVAAFGSSFDAEALFAFQNRNGLPKQNVSAHVNPGAPAGNPLEADLDLQFLMGMAPGADTWFFQQGGDEWLLALLDAVDALDIPPWVQQKKKKKKHALRK